MQSRSVAVISAGALLALLSLVAVAAAREPAGPVVDGPVFAAGDEGNGVGLTALVAGRLRMEDGCLLLAGIPVVWPYETTWDADAEAVVLSDGARAAVGDEVSGGGGYLHVDRLTAQSNGEFTERLRACPTDEWGQVAVFNRDEPVAVVRE
jgi:hypothetical protein